MKTAATNSRNFRTFLLVSQLEAKQIGARLQLARKEAGLTQEQVADISTVSKRSLQDYEAGVTIPYAHFRELAGIYRCDVNWLLHGEQEPAEPPLLEEVSASVAALTDGMTDAIERLERIEGLLVNDGASDTGATRRR
jgi:transcriptional regulator with XRE-family HTH domain